MFQIRRILPLLALACLVATAAGTSSIQIFTHPGGGTVCLDDTCQVNVGTSSGYSSTQFPNPTCGRDHTIRIYGTDGFEDYTDTVYMAYNCNSVTRRIYLEPLPATPAPAGSGDIQVFVSPGLGQVCRDGVECESSTGEVTDTWSVRFSDVTPDTVHTIAATADGYQPFSSEVIVTPGGISNVDIVLQPVATPVAAGALPDNPPATKAAPAGPAALCAAAISGAVLLFRKRGE